MLLFLIEVSVEFDQFQLPKILELMLVIKDLS